MEYKTSAEALARSEISKKNVAKKKYHHKLGPGGTRHPRLSGKNEATMIEQGITPVVVDWPIRSKQWFYMHVGMLHPATG
jgi:hypothetical protein